jgi:hypothetical protein
MKKSVITSDFEKKETAPPYHVTHHALKKHKKVRYLDDGDNGEWNIAGNDGIDGGDNGDDSIDGSCDGDWKTGGDNGGCDS